jgi:hypothetical protein
MRKNHSISLTNPKTCAISAALAHLSRACRSRFGPLLFWLAALLIIVSPVPAESQTNPQQKLVGTGAVGPAEQGWSVALSADGNTAIVGGVADNAAAGAAWVYTRSGSVWTQQGSKLVGTGAVGSAGQALSVALSDDGNTAIVGGPWDNRRAGAVWLYTRSRGAWTQQGSKLVGTGAVGSAWQGVSVALSADGNTAIVGGSGDNSDTGAVWVYTRSGGVWTPQGSKLVGTGAVGNAGQGLSVSLSGDGNTGIVGGSEDNSGTGAAWLYTRSVVSGPSKAASWLEPAQLETPDKATPSRCPATATPRLLAGLPTMGAPGRRGSTPAAAVSGPSRAPSWSASARLDTLDKATPSRCPATAILLSWAGLPTTGSTGLLGSIPSAAMTGAKLTWDTESVVPAAAPQRDRGAAGFARPSQIGCLGKRARRPRSQRRRASFISNRRWNCKR